MMFKEEEKGMSPCRNQLGKEEGYPFESDEKMRKSEYLEKG